MPNAFPPKFSSPLIMGSLALALLGAANAAVQRSYVSGYFQLDLDGTTSMLHSAEGGHAYGVVVEEAAVPGTILPKHISTVKYEDFNIELGISAGPAMKDWISSTLDAQHTRKSGAFHSSDLEFKERSTRTFTDALITEISFPKLDAAAKEPGFLKLTLAPEFTELKPASGWVDPVIRGSGKQETWLPSDFRLEIQGLDCSKVHKIDAITVKQTVAKVDVGEIKDPSKEPGKLEFPNLILTLPESAAQSFQDYFDAFVIKGNAGESQEKTGSLIFLNRNRKKELLRLTLSGMGIFKISPAPKNTSDNTENDVQVAFYVEKISLAPSGPINPPPQ